jgi:hypothetical protein
MAGGHGGTVRYQGDKDQRPVPANYARRDQNLPGSANDPLARAQAAGHGRRPPAVEEGCAALPNCPAFRKEYSSEAHANVRVIQAAAISTVMVWAGGVHPAAMARTRIRWQTGNRVWARVRRGASQFVRRQPGTALRRPRSSVLPSCAAYGLRCAALKSELRRRSPIAILSSAPPSLLAAAIDDPNNGHGKTLIAGGKDGSGRGRRF